MVSHRIIYDSAIVFFLLDRNDANGRPTPQSFTDIYKMIVNMGFPTVGKDTIQRHLNKLIKGQWVVKLPNEGRGRRYNKTLYIYSPKTKAMIGPPYRCERCGLTFWDPRKYGDSDPIICPKCKSPYWNKPRRA